MVGFRNFCSATFLLVGVFGAAAQESIQYGSIAGRVTDPSGAVIAGAKVSTRQTETNIASSSLTDKEGRFRFPYLRVGQYELRIQQPGFAESARSVTVTLGSAYEVSVTLTVASAETNVTVNAEADLIETARTQI